MKITVYDKVTGAASKHWPVDADEIVERGRGRYTTDPEQVEGDVSQPQLAEAPSAQEEAELQLASAQADLEEASAEVAEHAEAESAALEELGDMEAETGEPITPQVQPSHFLDEEQANYPSEWKYRRHAVAAVGGPAAKAKRRPSVGTGFETEAEQRRAAALRKAQDATAAVRAASAAAPPADGPRKAAKDSKAVSEHKKALEQQKAEAEKARQARKEQRAKEREERKAARDAAKAAEESGGESQPQ
jgi:hypothetical protein